MMKVEDRKLLLAALLLILCISSAQAYRCTDGLEIDDENVCDFREDCSDGVDESTCPSTCNFEDGLCQWYHETESADLNWTMFNNNEPAWYYGPAADHTLNSASGHYLYVDDTYTEVQQKAIIRSPTYRMAARGCVFSMWYNVYGVDFGTLKVFQYTPSNDRNYNLMTAVDRSEDKETTDRWNLYEVQVEACAENFQISIEATDVNDYISTGGYAIDDFRFEGCAYTLPLPTGGSCNSASEDSCDSGHCYLLTERCDFTPNCCDGTDESYNNCIDYTMCDFETGMCGWEQLTDDTKDWTWQTGGTGTGNTGPWIDHTTFSNDGHFIYTEVNDALPGDTYRVGSFYIQPTSSGCEIRFYHHMRGSGIGTLNMYTRTKIDGPMFRLWYSDTAHGNYWLYQSVPLTNDAAFQVIFEGIRGSSNLGDIALDDITFTPGCIESTAPLPPADAIPTQTNNCPAGMRPCNMEQCIDESHYCDFIPDCPIGGEDEMYCPASCDFETAGVLNTCYWGQDVNDDFDWSWYNAPDMDDSYKGPRTDHTTSSTTGHYIYVDGTISSMNTYTKLISPIYKKSSRACTFSMYYYMFGVEYGDLEIRLINLEGLDTRLTKVDDNALDYNKWILSESVIPACTKNFQIVIEAEDKQVLPAESGFAVDDIALIDCAYPVEVDPGTCSRGMAQCDAGECYPSENQCDFTQDCCDMSDEDPQICSQLGYSMCNFEIDLCDWSQLTTDEFDWRRNRGDTSSEGTGPKVDHTFGTDEGYYIYTEASNPKKLGERARLASFTIQGSATNVCTIRFWYHMRGIGMGELTVYTRTQVNGPLTSLWTMSRDQDNTWFYQTLDIRSTSDFQIILEGTIGTTTDGDMALDDISLTPGCVAAVESLPSLSTVPPSQIACSPGQLPCNMGCIDESSYCDFKHDCLPREEDEIQCPVFCNFEDDLCYWTQADDNEVDWTWYNHGEDPLTYNGPDSDHTTGGASGHYIYVDGSISREDQKATIISPMYKKSKRGCVFTLWYYMFGIEYGDLEVRLMTQDGQDYQLTKANDGAQDYNKWMIHVTEIPPCTSNFQVAIESEDRQVVPSEGGFAVDDLLFQDCEYPEVVAPGSCGFGMDQCATGECYPTSQMCDFTPDCCDLSDEQDCSSRGYTMCDFESGLCQWDQLSTDEFDWTRKQGSTSSSGTGPSSDHTTGSGYYLYTEASGDRRNGDRAKLASYTIQSTVTGQCAIRFFYHMEGIGIGTLNVYIRTAINGPRILLWTKERAIGGEWVYETIPLRSSSDFQVIIDGVIGYTTDSDIGLDDVSFTPDCAPSGNTLPVATTSVITEPPTRTVSLCRSGNKYCAADRKCIAEIAICDGVWDCTDGSDEQSCPVGPNDNKGLIIGLSVTFGLAFLVAIALTAVYFIRKKQSKSSDPSLTKASCSTGMSNPGYGNEKPNNKEIAFTMDRSDA